MKDDASRKISPTRRTAVRAGAALAAAAALGWPALSLAQGGFPSKPIKIVVPYSPGTGSDAVARTVAQAITEKTGHAVIIENKEGGGSLIGTLAVANAPADGYTILIAANPLVIVPTQNRNAQYDPVRDFTPIVKVGVIPLVLTVAPSLKVNTVKELVAYAKANPGKLNYGSSGTGTISEQEMELFDQAVGIDVQEIPYKSTAQAMTDLIGGQLPLFPAVVPSVAPHVKSGRAKAIAVFDTQRSQLLPDVPAVSEEVHVPGYTPTPVWYGFVGPANLPPQVVATLSSLIGDAVNTPDVKNKLVGLGARPISVGSEQFAADIKTEYAKAGALAKRLAAAKK